jgi:O-antigen/teichoic acid export membrane protein
MDVTHYKYLSLLPFSLVIIPNIVLTTDFVRLTKAITDRKFIDTYIRNYLLIFVIITVLIWAVCLLFTNEILLFFGKDFQALKTEFYLLLAGISSVLLIRGLFGNLLSASGLSKLNFWISIAAIGLNLILNILLIPRYGIFGAALTTAITMWITSLLSVFLFYHYRKKVSGSF